LSERTCRKSDEPESRKAVRSPLLAATGVALGSLLLHFAVPARRELVERGAMLLGVLDVVELVAIAELALVPDEPAWVRLPSVLVVALTLLLA